MGLFNYETEMRVTMLPGLEIPILPGISDRITIVGQTGSGKTHGGLWHLSKFDLKNQRWIIINTKNEKLIDSIPRARFIGYEIPRKNGLYIVHPRIDDEKELTKFLWDILDEEDIGLFFDEGYMIEFIGAVMPYIAIMTQGRSKNIPVMSLYQRPIGVTRFSFSEAQYIQIYNLKDYRDYEVTENWMPSVYGQPLPKHYSWYWDDPRKIMFQFSPVPGIDQIYSTMNTKLFTRKI